MADFRVISAGNISDYATRLYNITLGANATALPTVGDNVYANGFTLQLNVSVDLGGGKFSNELDAGLGVASGGNFNVSVTNLTIIGDRVAGLVSCDAQSTSGIVVNWIGNIIGGNNTNSHGCTTNASLTINNIGTYISGGSSTTARGCLLSSGGTINNTYSYISGGTGTNSTGCLNQGTGTMNNIVSNIYGNVGNGCENSANGTVNNTVVGVYGGTNGIGCLQSSDNGVMTFDKNVLTTIENGTLTNSSFGIVDMSNTPITLLNADFTNGISAVGNIILENTIKARTDNTPTIEVFSTGVADYPSEDEVLKGVKFAFNTKEGKCHVPPKETVSLGVPVGVDEVGEAIFTVVTG